jgi:uncharacterized protein with GYD domain
VIKKLLKKLLPAKSPEQIAQEKLLALVHPQPAMRPWLLQVDRKASMMFPDLTPSWYDRCKSAVINLGGPMNPCMEAFLQPFIESYSSRFRLAFESTSPQKDVDELQIEIRGFDSKMAPPLLRIREIEWSIAWQTSPLQVAIENQFRSFKHAETLKRQALEIGWNFTNHLRKAGFTEMACHVEVDRHYEQMAIMVAVAGDGHGNNQKDFLITLAHSGYAEHGQHFLQRKNQGNQNDQVDQESVAKALSV